MTSNERILKRLETLKRMYSDNKIAVTTGTSGDIMGGDRLALIMANVSKMFTIDHVHND